MNAISIFEIFKIGVGPSSSHTLGPWNAARDFASHLTMDIDRVTIRLYGSLSKTGKGHATDIAVQLGLENHDSTTIPVSDISQNVQRIRDRNEIIINGKAVSFDASRDIIFEKTAHELHPNTVVFEALYNSELKLQSTYASTGGGFIEKQGAVIETKVGMDIPYPISTGKDTLGYTDKLQCAISMVTLKNELHLQEESEIRKRIDDILDTMLDSIYRGCTIDGVLPGGLNVKRRAKSLCLQLNEGKPYANLNEWLDTIRNAPRDFNKINRWISCFALAVNEENASLSRVVTSPTNGAAGVIPAVIMYNFIFGDYKGRESLHRFLLTAGEIGCIFKKGATISAAVGGCQAEIGVSSAMAAGGLTEVMGGTPRQVLMAAEIAMEHHLGMTCDPIGGLVQIPCIERNAMGAIKAITAANLALTGDPHHAKVDIDTVIKTMWDTAQEMNSKYKETSEGGLAYNLPVILPEC